jgi:chromosome segregation ATPase
MVNLQPMAGPADNLRDAVERTVEATVKGAEERLSKGRRSMTEALEGRRPATADDIKELQKELRAIGRRLDTIEERLPKKRAASSAKRGGGSSKRKS